MNRIIGTNNVKQMIRDGHSIPRRKEEPTDEQVNAIHEPEIYLPEIYTSRKWKEANPEVDPMTAVPKEVLDVLLEKQDRRITLIENGSDAQKAFSVMLKLPVPDQIVRNLMDLQEDIEVIYCPKEKTVALVSDHKWNIEARDKFYELRSQALEIITPIYNELKEKLNMIPNASYTFGDRGISVLCAGVDLSDYYRPNSLVSAHIAAEAAGHKLEMKVHHIQGSIEVVLPEISGNITLQMLATKFNEKLAPYRAQLPNFDLVAAFVAPSVHHDGLDIVNVRPDGNGGYVNLSRDLSLYLYGKDLFEPVFKHENDMMMLSIEDIDAFAVADCADWIDYSEF